MRPNSRGKVRQPGTKDLAAAVKTNNPIFLDFIRMCLQWEPGQRLTPDEALQHPFITAGENAPLGQTMQTDQISIQSTQSSSSEYATPSTRQKSQKSQTHKARLHDPYDQPSPRSISTRSKPKLNSELSAVNSQSNKGQQMFPTIGKNTRQYAK